MITRCSIYETGGVDPHVNLAREECLLEALEPGEAILYLWQNERTVVIGRNQNAYDECSVENLEADGGYLARRISGGGAVYHDLGNLNFTFILPTAEWDLDRQTDVLLRAMRALHIRAERTGRNDLTVDGRKFSGHAYYHHGGKSFHHGTVMVYVDPEDLARYLTVSPLKLGSKGVASARSRVMNLVDIKPDLDIDDLKEELVGGFQTVFGSLVEPFAQERFDAASLAEKTARHRSREWLLREQIELDTTRHARLDWGTVRIDFSAPQGVITKAMLWSDGLDADELEAVPAALAGAELDLGAIAGRLESVCPNRAMARDIASVIIGEEL